MAVVLRSNTDLVYLPDHGYVGEEGALRILMQVQANTTRLDVSHNLLGNEGVITFVKGLSHLRQRYSSDTSRVWSLREINLGCNAVGDEGLESVLGWAKKDPGMGKLLLQANEIKARFLPCHNVDGIVHYLNSTKLTTLSLTNNPLDPDGLSSFLSSLNCPTLTQLHLSTCKLPPRSAGAIADFLRSPRSRMLEYLELNGNRLGAEGVRQIVDVVEEHHFGIVQVGLLANEQNFSEGEINGDGQASIDHENGAEGERIERVDPVAEGRQLHHQVHERLPDLVLRNRFLTRRVRRAALRAIGPARILLHAQSPSDEQTAARVLAEVSSVSSGSADTIPRPFRLLELPPEVLNHIVRHCSQDPYALSGSQFARLRTEAASREELRKMVRLRKERLKGIWEKDERVVKEREVREGWLRRGKWDKWEQQSAGQNVA